MFIFKKYIYISFSLILIIHSRLKILFFLYFFSRFRHDNILQLDLDLPDRTTQDFDGTIS
jgi:hypothetical protein